MPGQKIDVNSAYRLASTKDRKALYAAWAETYDQEFAYASDYVYPQHVARVFRENGGRGPVLDAGAGTGLLAQALLDNGALVIDAFDLSAEMLAVARTKDLYRRLVTGDLTQTLPFADESYAAVVSSGTFTHGHVGPEAFDELLRVAMSGALFVLSIKTELYHAHGFEGKLKALSSKIRGLSLDEVPVYGAAADADHAKDTGLIAHFRKT